MAPVRHADAISSQRDGQLDLELRVVDDGEPSPPRPPSCPDGAGVQQPLSATRSKRAGEVDAAPRIEVARAGEQDMNAGEKLGRLGFGCGGSRR
jgi:hypothetical protein